MTEIVDSQDDLAIWNYFPSSVYSIMKKDFLESSIIVADEYVAKMIEENPVLDEIYPLYQTPNIHTDPRMKPFADYIINLGYNILNDQGYDLKNYSLSFSECWVQQHYKHSGHERHVHGYNNVLSGFYFLKTPQDCSKLLIHDPRTAKEFGNFLPEKNSNSLSLASEVVNFIPEPGTIMITNSWLPHTISKNASNEPFQMIHFNITAYWDESKNTEQAATVI